jgi:hypothetical protein
MSTRRGKHYSVEALQTFPPYFTHPAPDLYWNFIPDLTQLIPPDFQGPSSLSIDVSYVIFFHLLLIRPVSYFLNDKIK